MCRKASFHTIPVPSSPLTPLSIAQCAVWTVSPLSTGHYTFCDKGAYNICVHYGLSFPHYGQNETQIRTGHFTSLVRMSTIYCRIVFCEQHLQFYIGFLSPHYRFPTCILYNKVLSGHVSNLY